MRRLVTTVALLVLAGLLVFPSAAAPFALGQSDTVTRDVTLGPADTPNGDYAYLDEEDELVVDLTAANPALAADAEGLNADGVTSLDGVFRVRYTGSRDAHVWLTHGSDDVVFYADGHPIQSEVNNVTLGPNQSVAVGLRVDTRGETTDGLVDDVTVHATVAEPGDGSEAGTAGVGDESSGTPAVALRAPNATARTVTVVAAPDGRPLTVDLDGMSACRDSDAVTLDAATVVREGAGNLDLHFRATRPPENVSAHTESLCAIRATETPDSDTVTGATVRFGVDRDALADRNVSADQLVVYRTHDGRTTEQSVRLVGRADDTAHIAVQTPGFSRFTVAAPRPDVAVTTADLGRTSIAPNETVTVTGRVVNDGRTTGTRSVTVVLDGTPVTTRAVTLAPDETRRVRLAVSPPAAGRYTVRLGNATAGTVEVASDTGPNGATTPTGDPSADATSGGPTGLDVGRLVALLGALAATAAGLAGLRWWSR
jgi:hypothetical protein